MRARGAALVLALTCVLGGCAQTFDATTLGVPATLASAAGQPPAGDRFKVSSKALFGPASDSSSGSRSWSGGNSFSPRIDSQ